MRPSISQGLHNARERLSAYAWPAELIHVLTRLRANGGQAYIVGGHVRDVLLGREPDTTFDVATAMHPDDVMRHFSRVVPTGLRHGTVTILEGAVHVECTTFRREGVYGDARRPDEVVWTRELGEDLARRDLTINALAFDPLSGELVDPFDGTADLKRGVLRTVGPPEERFAEDALRPLRVARFAATLEMQPEPATRAALGNAIERSGSVAAERVQQELRWMLEATTPSRGLDLMQESGLLRLWLPELDTCVGIEQNRFHAHDVYRHSVLTCDAAPADQAQVRWAGLLHDIGKPATREVRTGGEATFYRHEIVGAEMAAVRLGGLRFPQAESYAIVHLVREHMFDYRSEWSDAAVRRWLRRVSPACVDDLFTLRRADVTGSGIQAREPEALAAMYERIDQIMFRDNALNIRDLRVDGSDVMRVLGLSPGPRVGKVLDDLLDEVLESPELNERERLLARLRAGLSSGASDRGDA